MRIAATWTKELESRHGRALGLSMSAGLAVGGVIVGEQGGEGKFEMHPFGVQGLFQIAGRLGLGGRRQRGH